VGITVARTRVLQTGGQEAVALTPSDGESIFGDSQSNFLGNGYYHRNGFTRARDWTGPNPLGGSFAGFDDPDFIPISVWLPNGGPDFYTRMDDLALNGNGIAGGDIDLDDGLTFGKWNIVEAAEFPADTISSTHDPVVVGVHTADEPWNIELYEGMVSANAAWLASGDGPGRFAYNSFFDNILNNGDIEFVYFQDDMILARDNDHPDPPASYAGWSSCDAYWFAGATLDLIKAKLHSQLYAIGGSATQTECARGSHYGSIMDVLRKWYPVNDRRIFYAFIEDGAPYTETFSMAITPAQLKWAVWSTMVHGARAVDYFNHTFRADDPLGSFNVLNHDGYGGPGIAGTGIYAAVKEIDRFILELASVLNSPFDGYLCFGDGTQSFETTGFLTACSSTNSRGRLAGIDASCKWQPVERKHYILAATREADGSTNWPVTYRMVDQGQTTAQDLVTDTPISIERGGGIPGGFCEFDDTFATAASYKAYRID
jgi:hypothetical protein